MSLTKLSLGGNIPAQVEFFSDMPAGDGKIVKLFYSVWFGYIFQLLRDWGDDYYLLPTLTAAWAVLLSRL
jgi:hypothetical protein